MLLRPACRFVLGLVGALACLAGVAAPAVAAPEQEQRRGSVVSVGQGEGVGADRVGPVKVGGAAAAPGGSGKVVVVGFSGVRWQDVTSKAAPNLYAFGKKAAVGNLVVRTINETTCPTEGWLTLGAGQRTVDDARTCDLPERGARWRELAKLNSASKYHAKLGQLGEALKGVETAAIGPGAALALADSRGRLRAEYAPLAPLPGSVDPASAASPSQTEDPDAAAKAYRDKAVGAKVAVVDLGAVRAPDSRLSSGGGRPGFWQRLGGFFTTEPSTPPEVASQVSALDTRFGSLLTAVREKDPNATVMVVSLADSQSLRPSLGYFAVAGPHVARGASLTASPPFMATSDATRQKGYVQITDLMPTLLGWTVPGSSEAADAIGSRIFAETNGTGQANIRELVGNQVRSQTARSLSGPFFVVLGALFAAVLVLFLRRSRWSETTRGFFLQLSGFLAALPVASLLVNLVPWWNSSRAPSLLVALLVTISAVIAWAALNRRWKDGAFTPFGVIGGLVVVTLMLDVAFGDVLFGYPLQLASLFGTQPLVGWRFYGFSNAAFALFTAGLILFLAWAGERLRSQGRGRMAAWLIVAVGAVAVFLDGSASYGADFGGPPVIIVALGILSITIFRKRFTWVRIVAVLLLAVVVSTAFAVLDYLNPAGRSHLGRFVETVMNGNGMEIVARKFTQVFGNLPWSMIAVLVLALGLAAFWARRLHRRDAFSWISSRSRAWNELPVLRASVTALLWSLIVGAFINDSGVLIPAMGLLFSAPLWFVAVVRFEESDSDGEDSAGGDFDGEDSDGEDSAGGEGAKANAASASRADADQA